MEETNPPYNTPYQLILEELEGKISAQDLQQLENWKAASADHLKTYHEIVRLNDHIELLALSKTLDPEKAWTRFSPALNPSLKKVSGIQTYYKWAAVAAVLLAFVYFGGLGFLTGVKTIETGNNQQQTVILPDGSEMVMNNNTSVSYNNRRFLENRTVMLRKGEAFFNVQHQSQHPFMIKTNDVLVKDMGTSFNLKLIPEQIIVVVNSGQVSLENPKQDKKLLLSAKDKGVFDRQTKEMTATANTDLNYKSWYDKKLQFTNTPLKDVVRDLQTTYGTKILFQDQELQDRKLTARFDGQSEDQVMQIIAVTLKLQLQKKDHTFVLYR